MTLEFSHLGAGRGGCEGSAVGGPSDPFPTPCPFVTADLGAGHSHVGNFREPAFRGSCTVLSDGK